MLYRVLCSAAPRVGTEIFVVTGCQGKARFEPFDPFVAQPKMSYKDGYQERYFVLDSFQAGTEQLKAYCDMLQQPPDLPDPDRIV